MEEFVKIRDYLFNINFTSVEGIDSLFEILEDRQTLSNIIYSYGDELSVSSSPEFAMIKEKYSHVC